MKAKLSLMLFLSLFVFTAMLKAETSLISKPPVVKETVKDSSKTSLFDKYFELESGSWGYNGQFNKTQNYHSVFFMRLNHRFKDSRFSIESSPFTFSMFRSGSEEYFSLNPISLLIFGAVGSNGSCLDESILLPLLALTGANMATNMEIDIALDKKGMFNIMCGTTGDMYIINETTQFKYTFYTGVLLFKPLSLKLFYAKNIFPFHSIDDDEMFGFSILKEFEF